MRWTLGALIILFLVPAWTAAEELVLEYRFERPRLERHPDGQVDVRVDGCPVSLEPGQPMLPVFSGRVLLPAGRRLAGFECKTAPPELLGRPVRVSHCPGLFPTAVAGREPVAPDPRIYTAPGPFPEVRAAAAGVQWLKGYPVALFTLHPVVYHPAAGELRFIPRMRLVLQLAPESPAKAAPMRRPLADDRAEVAALVDNPATLDGYAVPSAKTLDTAWEYLIVTNAALEASFQTLATHKAARGLNVHLARIEDVLAATPGTDNAHKLRTFIAAGYQDHGTRWVMLGGDSEIIPWRGAYGKVGDTVDAAIPTDLYFAALDGDWNANGNGLFGEPADETDLFAEVAVGRIAASTPAEATNQIQKIIDYENSAPPFRALLLGEKLDDQTWGGDSKDVVYAEMAGVPAERLYDAPDSSWTADTLIDSYFNADDTHIVNHLGHANSTYCLKMYNADVSRLTNTNPFFVYSQGCYPGNFIYDMCFAERMTVGTAAAAFAVIMNTRYGWYAANGTNGTSNVFDWEFMRSVFEQFRRQLGLALNESRQRLAGLAGDGSYRWVYFETTLFGCPETDLRWTCTPAAVRLVPDQPAGGFIVMDGDDVALRATVGTDCAGPVNQPQVTARVVDAAGTRNFALRDDGSGADAVAGDGLFSGQWVPAGPDNAQITYSASAPGLAADQDVVQGEVVERMDYLLQSRAPDWIDPAGGTAILAGQDDAGMVAAIGFPFKFYGKTYEQVLISTNGLLRFADAYDWDAGNTAMPRPESPNAVIAALWTDLDLTGVGAVIRYRITGQAPERLFVVSWLNVAHYNRVGAVTFQIALEESTHRIYFNYRDTEFDNPAYDFGADATVGIEDYNGTKGIQYAFREPVVESGLSLCFMPVIGPMVVQAGWQFSGGDGDGIPEPGETVSWQLTLQNIGTEPAADITAGLATDMPEILIDPPVQLYGSLAVGAVATREFSVTVDDALACGAPLDWLLTIGCRNAAGDIQQWEQPIALNAGEAVERITFADDVEAGEGEWSHVLDQGVTDWSPVAGWGHSPVSSWFTPGEGSVKDNSLLSPWFEVPDGGQLSFWHDYDLEPEADGGVLEIRTAAEPWTDLGPAMVAGGYTHELDFFLLNPLGRRAAWSGDSQGFIQTRVDLAAYSGRRVQVRFRLGCDLLAGTGGWYVDDVRISGSEYRCILEPDGDLDGDGRSDARDLALLLHLIVGNLAPGVPPCLRPDMGDLDRSGTLDALDCRLLAGRLAE